MHSRWQLPSNIFVGLSDPIAQSETFARGFYRQVALHLADLGIRVESRPDAKSRRVVFLWRHRDINALAHGNSYKNYVRVLETATTYAVHRRLLRVGRRIQSKCRKSAGYRKCYPRTYRDLSAQKINIARAIAVGIWQRFWQISEMVLYIFPGFPAAFLRGISRSSRSRAS